VTRSERAWEAFRARVTELGGSVIEPAWLGSLRPHRVVCALGHECSPQPHNIQKGGGLCRSCAGRDSATAEAAFRGMVAELGGTVVEPRWLGSHRPHKVVCASGHECSPHPSSVQQGQGLCRVCAGLDPATVEAAFRSDVESLGGTVVEPMWLGRDAPHRVVCSAGHECSPRPSNLRQGQGLCQTCAGQDSDVAEAAFRDRVAELGGTVVEPTWLGNHRPHKVVCAAGHECAPRPHSVRQGQGLCHVCAGQIWDCFYIAEDVDLGRIKFGITSGDPRNRLNTHRYGGYRSVIRLITDLPGDTARAIERRVLSALKLAGEQPIQGREYFGAHVLATVLDIVDHYPIPAREGQKSC
jgi:hypothetical protein